MKTVSPADRAQPKLLPLSLCLNDFKLQVFLGASLEERQWPQEVLVTVDLRFAQSPLACTSDQLKDTLCYASLCQHLAQSVQGKSFHLMEALTHHLFEVLIGILEAHSSPALHLILRVTKHPVLLPALTGGVTLTLEGKWPPLSERGGTHPPVKA